MLLPWQISKQYQMLLTLWLEDCLSSRLRKAPAGDGCGCRWDWLDQNSELQHRSDIRGSIMVKRVVQCYKLWFCIICFTCCRQWKVTVTQLFAFSLIIKRRECVDKKEPESKQAKRTNKIIHKNNNENAPHVLLSSNCTCSCPERWSEFLGGTR